MKTTVALIRGGSGKEHDVSCMGYAYVRCLLEKNGYDVISVYIDKNGNWSITKNGEKIPTFPILLSGISGLYCNGKIIEIDVAIPLLHGDGGESGEVQGLLESARIRYIGAKVATSALCLDKSYTKRIVRELGIPVTKWVDFSTRCDTEAALKRCLDTLSFPMFIKPRALGSSIGAYAVVNEDEFSQAFFNCASVSDNRVMVEEMICDKRELECAFYSVGEVRLITPPGEILHKGFYTYNDKYQSKTETAVVADVDITIKNRLTEYSLAIAEAVNLRHLARIDYFLTRDGIIFNEINTFPGFTDESLYPKMIAASGITPEEALSSFIKDALGC